MGSLPALIAAAVALGTIQLGDDDIKDAEQLKTGIDAVDDAIDDLVDLRDNTYAATGERYIYCILYIYCCCYYSIEMYCIGWYETRLTAQSYISYNKS